MTFLSANDLTAIKATQNDALPDTCTISRRTLASDGMGGYTETWASLATGVACRLAAALYRPEERSVAEKFAGQTLWTLTLPAGQAITSQDRVVIGSTTYEVVGILSAGQTWETARRALLVKVA